MINKLFDVLVVHGRKACIASNLLGGGLNLLAFAVTKQKRHLVWTIGSAGIVLFLNTEWFKKAEEKAVNYNIGNE